MEDPLSKRVIVEHCPRCGVKWSNEPYITGDQDGRPVIGLVCGCGMKTEVLLEQGMPLQVNLANAIFGAMCQVVKVAFMLQRDITITINKEQDMKKTTKPEVDNA
ncbi:MAG: hypothetical protein LHW45_08055 [Candidatus Cloacimonetes bacterium]|nr:hypothetical protein [Candidatus Cloacimonadota bacterium]MDY0367562.1 hypothetical protein [Candidatus Syntrophosphaera sp.]